MLHRKFWNYICCRVFLSFILSAFHKRSKCCLSPCDGVCDLVHDRMGLLVGMPVWRGNYSSNMVACPVLSWTSLLSAYLHFTAAGAGVITCAHRAQGCAHNLSGKSGIHAILRTRSIINILCIVAPLCIVWNPGCTLQSVHLTHLLLFHKWTTHMPHAHAIYVFRELFLTNYAN